MNYMGLIKEDTSNYKGISLVLFVAGCNHNCKGCHNPESHNPCNGKRFTEDTLNVMKRQLERGIYDNLVLSGGDPLYHLNHKTIVFILSELKEVIKEMRIRVVLFSGFRLEDTQCMASSNKNIEFIMDNIDVMIDGKYDESKKVVPTKDKVYYFGSTNQRVINVAAMRRMKTKLDNYRIVEVQNTSSISVDTKEVSERMIDAIEDKPKNNQAVLSVNTMARKQLNDCVNKDKKNIIQSILKIGEEIGEVNEALICAIGTEGCEYKEKSFYDVEDELLDVLITTFSALSKVRKETGSTDVDLNSKIIKATSKWLSKL